MPAEHDSLKTCLAEKRFETDDVWSASGASSTQGTPNVKGHPVIEFVVCILIIGPGLLLGLAIVLTELFP